MLLPLTRKAKGDLAEMRVAADLLERGHKIAFLYGEDWDYGSSCLARKSSSVCK